MAKRAYVVRAHWDADARRWWADSDDVPGLVSESATFEELVERVVAVVPELLQLNHVHAPSVIPIHVQAERIERVRLSR